MNNIHFVTGAIVIAGAMISGAVVYSNTVDCGAERSTVVKEDRGETETTEKTDISDIDIDGWPQKGNPEASVVIIEYSDYVCPFSKRLNDEAMTRIKEKYVENGDVLLVFKDLPVVGGDRAAEAAHCAGEQGYYWEYHDILFENQTADRPKWSDPEIHRGYADRLGLDSAGLVECFNERRYRDKVIASAREAQALGGRGTPFVVINQNLISGAQPYQVFEQIIERELAN